MAVDQTARGLANQAKNKTALADKATTLVETNSSQRFNQATVVQDRLNTSTGGLFGGTYLTSNYYTSEYTALSDDTTTVILDTYPSAGSMNYNGFCWYDKNKKLLSAGFNPVNLTKDTYGRYNIAKPAGAKFFRICVQGVYQRLGVFYNSYSSDFNYYTYYDYNKNTTSKWKGKKVVAFGDSLAAGSSKSVDSWIGRITKKLGINPVNRGIGGSTVTYDSARIAWIADGTTDLSLGEYGEYVSRPSSLDDGSGAPTAATQPAGTTEINSSMNQDSRVNTIPTDADIIIIQAGTNGMDQASYDTMLQKIFTRCPNAIVMCCSITFRFTDSTKTTVTDVTASNTTIQNLCQKYGCTYIDLKGKECINQYNYTTYMSDHVHANNTGNERRARVIAKALESVEPLTY